MMKYLLCGLITLAVVSNLYCQDCKVLKNEQLFNILPMSGALPNTLLECSRPVKLEYAYYVDYRIAYDSLSKSCKKQYAPVFKFKSILFATAIISTTKRGKINVIELYNSLDEKKETDTALSKEPAPFTALSSELKAAFEQPSRHEAKEENDPLLGKVFGRSQLLEWECNNTVIQLRVNYGASQKGLNFIAVQFRDETIESVESLP